MNMADLILTGDQHVAKKKKKWFLATNHLNLMYIFVDICVSEKAITNYE